MRGPPGKIFAEVGKPPGVTILVGPRTRGLTNAALGAMLDELIGPEPQVDLFGGLGT